LSALRKELGVVGTAYFIRQFEAGRGDYTTEKDKLLENITLEDAYRWMEDMGIKGNNLWFSVLRSASL